MSETGRGTYNLSGQIKVKIITLRSSLSNSQFSVRYALNMTRPGDDLQTNKRNKSIAFNEQH